MALSVHRPNLLSIPNLEEVTFENSGWRALAGTLTLPGKTDLPVVVLISEVAGHKTRTEDDGTQAQHKCFADYLTGRGSVLRFDDRGGAVYQISGP